MVVQMLKTGAKAKPGDLQVAAVADVHLVDLVEVVLRGVRGEDVGQAGIHAHPNQRQPAARLPLGGQRELLVAELHARLAEGSLGMRLRQADGHVHVVRVGLERAAEDRHHELRVDRVHDEVGPMGAGELRNRRCVACVDLLGGEARSTAERVGQRAGAGFVVVGEDHRLAPVARRGEAADGLSHRADADEQDSHETPGVRVPIGARVCATGSRVPIATDSVASVSLACGLGGRGRMIPAIQRAISERSATRIARPTNGSAMADARSVCIGSPPGADPRSAAAPLPAGKSPRWVA